MGFNTSYIRQYQSVVDSICDHHLPAFQGIEIGTHLECPYPPEAIIEAVDLWVKGVEKLLKLAEETSPTSYSAQFVQLYKERGITYEEYYYLFSENITEAEYLKTPAYLFTKTFSKDLRSRRFRDFEFTPESYKNFILSLDIVPSQILKKKLHVSIPASTFLAHTYCVAKTRSGKTELLKLVVYNLIKHKEKDTSLLILDPHGEFARELKRLKIVEEHLDQFVYLDPVLDTDHTPVFNPFEIGDKSTTSLAYAADTILDAFQQLLRDQIITGNMRRLLRHCIYALLYHEGMTMMDLLVLLQGINRNKTQRVPEFFPDEQRLMDLGKAVPDPLTSGFFEHGWKDVDSRTVSAVVERIDGILSHPIVRRFMTGHGGKNSFDLESYMNSGKIVVVNLDFTRLGNMGSEAIGRLFVSEAQNISAQRNRLPRDQRPKTIIFMDECQRFVSAAIERALSEFGKFNTFLFLAHQYIEQIDDGMVKAMLSNTENKIIGRNSAASMGAISSDIGVEKEGLMEVKKYEFYMKSGDHPAFKFTSSDALLDLLGSPHYNTVEEAQKRIDPEMVRRYYRPVTDSSSNGSKQEVVASQNSSGLSIELSEDDF